MRLKHLNHIHDFPVQFHICHCLARFENLNCSRLDNNLSFGFHLRSELIVSLAWFSGLLPSRRGWYQIDSDIVARKLKVYFDLLIRVIQCGLLDLFVKNSNLGITEMDDRWLQEFIWYIRFFFNLLHGQLINVIVEAENGCLEYVANQLELLSCEPCHNFSLTIVVEP